MNAELLRRAGTKLRETAAKATPGPWEHTSTDDNGIRPLWIIGAPEVPGDGMSSRDVLFFTEEMAMAISDITEPEGVVTHADLEWIALANPALAEPLAAWLESDAGLIDDMTAAGFGDDILAARFAPALMVARVILGEVAA